MTMNKNINARQKKVPAKSRGNAHRDHDRSSFCLHDNTITVVPFGRKELYSPQYLLWMNDPDITRTIGRFDYLLPVGRSKLVDYVRSLDTDTTLFAAIYKTDTPAERCSRKGRFIGTLKIYDIDLLAQRASLGIMIGDRSEWGRGYAQRALRLASSYIFNVLGLRKITAGFLGTNKGMEQAFLKTGFKKEATFKKHLFLEGKFVDHVFVCKFRS